VLASLGVNIDAGVEKNLRSLEEANVCFLFAPAHHGAMRHVLPIRQELGFRTIFNLLGPLSNPARAQRQVMGVYDLRLVEPIARVLGMLGAERAWVFHGDGMDEMTTTGQTHIAEWRGTGVRLFTITPEAVGLHRTDIDQLRGGDPDFNAQAIRDLLAGKQDAYRDIVLLNTAAAFLVAEKAETLREGVEMAAAASDDGRAGAALDKLVEITNS
jgi:anthranilate phosphoribosyltransferase